jgi:hypothetical protein
MSDAPIRTWIGTHPAAVISRRDSTPAAVYVTMTPCQTHTAGTRGANFKRPRIIAGDAAPINFNPALALCHNSAGRGCF